jgi:hypothetical protein
MGIKGMPRPEGVHTYMPLPDNREVVHLTTKPSSTATLKDLAEEYVLFTHALLLTYGGFWKEPLVVYRAQQRPSLQLLQIDLPVPIIEGFEAPATAYINTSVFGRRLYGCPKEEWKGLRRYLDELQWEDPKRKIARLTLTQHLPILDVLAVRLGNIGQPFPTVMIYSIGVNGSDQQVVLAPVPDLLPGRCRVVINSPEAEMVAYAEAYFKGDAKEAASWLRVVDNAGQPVGPSGYGEIDLGRSDKDNELQK